jgi:hypothetical protein
MKISNLPLSIFFIALLFLSFNNVQSQTHKDSPVKKITEACIDLTAKPDIEVMRQVIPPTNNAYPTSEFIPGTIYSTLRAPDVMENSSNYDYSKYDLYHFLWANRCNTCNPKNKGNLPELEIGKYKVRFYFDTVNKANACTILQLRKLLNHDKGNLQEAAKSAGLRIAYTKDQVQAVSKNTNRAVNVCFMSNESELELSSNANLKGIVLDYEVGDGRSPTVTSSFIATLNRTLGDKKLIFYSNDIINGGEKNGIDKTSAPKILLHSDAVGILLHKKLLETETVASAINRQLGIYGANTAAEMRKVYVTFELNLDLNKAIQTRNIIKSKKLLGVMEWRNGANPGPILNKCTYSDFDAFHKKMICLSYGICK